MDDRLGVPVLDVDSLVAEELLANADRGLDDATYARDLIDLAFLAARIGTRRLAPGLAIAEGAYGAAAADSLAQSLVRLRVRPRLLSKCARALGVEDLRTLKKGIALLRPLANMSK